MFRNINIMNYWPRDYICTMVYKQVELPPDFETSPMLLNDTILSLAAITLSP